MSDVPPRFVLDTNTLVSAALFPASIPGLVLDRAVAEGLLVVSAQTLAECAKVLYRNKFDRYLSDTRRAEFLASLESVSFAVEIGETVTACRDPNDDKFLEVAVNGRANVIVTGDKDLLALHPFRDIPIVRPQAFLETFSIW